MTIAHAASLTTDPAPTTARPQPDLEAIKARQQATWSTGDYHVIATQIQIVAELLIERLDVRSTERVLDVATGSGNAAIAAARRGCEVVGIDYVPALLERARRRSKAEGLSIDYVEGDAEALTFLDGSFDVVTSVFGAMFAPDQERTAAELLRVTRSGGRIGIVAHTPDGFIGQLFRTIAKHVPPPAGLRSPIQWGTEVRLRELFGAEASDIRTEKRTYAFRGRSAEAWVETWRREYGPIRKAFDAVSGVDGRVALEQDLVELIGRFNRAADGTMVVPSEYLEAVIVKR
jgi:SAM-dependent methyltransferase